MIALNSARRALVLLSGGIDSTSCIVYYKEREFGLSALFVDYGQASAVDPREEFAFACLHSSGKSLHYPTLAGRPRAEYELLTRIEQGTTTFRPSPGLIARSPTRSSCSSAAPARLGTVARRTHHARRGGPVMLAGPVT